MLVVKRKAGEQIRIGDNILITITETASSHVFVGIQAPPAVPVFREEIVQRNGGKPPLPPARTKPKD